MPRAYPAMTWPFATLWRPAGRISRNWAAPKAGKVMSAEYSAPIGFPMISGITRKNQRITMSSGMERMRFTYADATAVRGRLFPSRAMAKSVPIAIPPLIAIRVRLALNFRPVQRNGRLGLRTLRSSWPSIPTRLLLCRCDIAGHAASLFDEGHHPVREEGADEVEDRDGQVGLDPLLGVLLHLAGLEGQLQHPDGERHGGVLEDVHELRGEGRA